MIAKGDFLEALQMIGQIAHRRADAEMYLTFKDGKLTAWEAVGEQYVAVQKKLVLDKLRRRRRCQDSRSSKKKSAAARKK